MSSRPLIQRIRNNISYERKSTSKKWLWFPTWQPATPHEKLIPAMPSNVVVTKKGPRMYHKYGLKVDDHRQVAAWKVTKLIKYERVEFSWHQALEIRGYAERLICEAIRNGPNHNATMELASFWLQEPNLVHKLFKVLVPRYASYTTSFTSLFKLPPLYEGSTLASSDITLTMRLEAIKDPFFSKVNFAAHQGDCGVLELKGNPFPPLQPPPPAHPDFITNILLRAARRNLGLNSRNPKSLSSSQSSEVEADPSQQEATVEPNSSR